jgi:hypothetical protein
MSPTGTSPTLVQIHSGIGVLFHLEMHSYFSRTLFRFLCTVNELVCPYRYIDSVFFRAYIPSETPNQYYDESLACM